MYRRHTDTHMQTRLFSGPIIGESPLTNKMYVNPLIMGTYLILNNNIPKYQVDVTSAAHRHLCMMLLRCNALVTSITYLWIN